MENKNYTTKANIETYLGGGEITDSLDLFIVSAQNYIDNYTGRNFLAGVDDEIRYFNGSGSRSMYIDPAVNITEVAISFDEGVNFQVVDGFVTEPLNTSPKVKLTLRNDAFPRSMMSVRLKGQFGWGDSAPADIIYVATALASGMYKGKSIEEVSSESIGDYSVSYKDSVDKVGNLKSILDKYKVLV